MNVFNSSRLWALCVMVVVATACQPSTPTEQSALPTMMDANAIATDGAATVTAEAALIASSQPPTLPPTWTPSPEPIQLPTETSIPTATPILGQGNLYYIFNGDSIVRLAADGSSEQLILVGGAPSDLHLSPDGTLLIYVAQGNGSAREVFVSNLDGTYTQEVSCLGFSRVIAPTWSPDSKSVVFAASQSLNGALGIYLAGIAGSGQCPTGNNQHLIVQTELNGLNQFTWRPDGTQVFFDSDVIYGVDVINGVLYPPLTATTGYGPDFSPVYNPLAAELYYLKTIRDDQTGEKGGKIYHIEADDLESLPLQEMGGEPIFARSLLWSADGGFLAITTEQDVRVQDKKSNTSVLVVEGSNFFPQPTFSPDAGFVAYVDAGRGSPTISQVFTVERDGSNRTQITTHQEGTISDLNWSSN